MSPRILIVEDDPYMLQGICDALDIAGYETQPASNGVQALECLKQSRFDLILSDIMMPNMDGYELFEKVRSQADWTPIPFIFLTAKGQKTDIRFGKRLGADDYLTKPFEVEDLLVAVQSKLERARALRDVADAEMTQLKRNILNTLSHEFRTPLTYISGYTALLQDGDVGAAELKLFLENIRKGSDRLKRLIDDFLLIVMFETGEAQSVCQAQCSVYSDLADHINRLLDMMEDLARARQVMLQRELPDRLPPLMCHLKYLLDAVRRMVDNAIKFSKREGGTVLVRAWATDEVMHITVSDEGIGISPDQRSKLFERFSQIDREKMEQQGTGVGLFIVKSIATLHGGQVDVESEPGAGSVFTISLPLESSIEPLDLLNNSG